MSKIWPRLSLSVAIFILVFAGWAALLGFASTEAFAGLLKNFSSTDLDRSAKLGDTFGTFSALMAAFAAAGAVLALSEQRRAVQRQMFVTTVVAMLDRLQQTIEDTDFFVVESIPNADGTYDEKIVESQTGQSAFYEMSQELRLFVSENFYDEMADQEKAGVLILLYKKFYKDYKDSLGHFFRQLYHIVRYIDEEGGEECDRFLKIVRASLTNAQLLLLGYNSIAGEGRIKFSKLITRYSMLHNLSFEDDDLGRMERLLFVDRLGEKALMSDSELGDFIEPRFLKMEQRNAFAKVAFRDFLAKRGMSVNFDIEWKN